MNAGGSNLHIIPVDFEDVSVLGGLIIAIVLIFHWFYV